MNRIKPSKKIVPESWSGADYHRPRSIFKEIYSVAESTLDFREKLWMKFALGGLVIAAAGVGIYAVGHLGIDNAVNVNQLSSDLEGFGAGITVVSAVGFGKAVSDHNHNQSKE